MPRAMGSERWLRNKERRHRRGQCYSRSSMVYKFAYVDFLEALLVAAKMQRLYPQYRYSVYECGKCGLIHVGRVPPGTVWMMDGWSVCVDEGQGLEGDGSNQNPGNALALRPGGPWSRPPRESHSEIGQEDGQYGPGRAGGASHEVAPGEA